MKIGTSRGLILSFLLAVHLLVTMGCTLRASLTSLDKPSTVVQSLLNIDDGNVSLSLTSSPIITWSDCPDSQPELRIVRVSDSVVMKAWHSSVTATSASGLSLTVGTIYRAEVRCVDSAGTEVIIGQGDGWLVPGPLVLSPGSSISMLTGESVTFLGSGGVPNYSYSDSLNIINTLTGLFKPALGLSPTTSLVKVTDSFSQQSSTVNVKISAFEEKMVSQSTFTGSHALAGLGNIVEHNGAWFTGAYMAPPSGGSTKPSYSKIYKSTNSGATWTAVSNFQAVPGAGQSPATWLASGGAGAPLYMSGALGTNNFYIAESTDDGATWTNKKMYTINLSGATSPFQTALVTTTDNSLLMAGSTTDGATATTFILKCNRTTWSCVATDLNENVDGFSRSGPMAKDATGNIYYGTRLGPIGSTQVFIKKSTDHGVTWNTIATEASTSLKVSALAVSTDGQMILYGGASGASSPYLKQSTNGGTSWVSTTSSCASGWEVVSILIASNKDALQSCYNFSAGYTAYMNFKTAAVTSWTNLFSVAGENRLSLYSLSSGNILYAAATVASLKTSSNFGTSWTSLGFPTHSTVINLDAQLDSVTESNSVLYAAGSQVAASADYDAVVYRSTNGGTTWTQQLTHSTGSAVFGAIAKSATTNTVITSGSQATSLLTYRHDGTSWALSESYAIPSTFGISVSKIVSNSSGHFFIIGSYLNSSSFVFRMFIRQSVDDGVTWTTLDDYLYQSSYYTKATGGATKGNDLYIAGYGGTAAGNHWLVRKYSSSVWSIEDDAFPVVAGATDSKAVDILSASDGSLYVAGTYTDASNVIHWIVKRKPAGGAWTVIDDFNLESGFSSAPMKIIEDASNRILVSGYGFDSSGIKNAVIRSYYNSKWSTVDKFVSYADSTIMSIAPCLTNRVCSAGYQMDSNIMYRGFVRIISP